jgi:LytS/YehU family sensor histidine kinase
MKDQYHILYIDDEPDNLMAFSAVFRRHYTVFSAQSAEEATALLQRQQIDLIISDQRMPRMTGVEFFEKISTDFPDVIRMILTGYSDVQAIVDAINKGKVYYYITKPWEMQELKVILDNALEAYALKIQNKQLETEKNKLLLQTAWQEKERIATQFEMLKNQINPHFLFNSINVLSSLIRTDPPKALEFTQQFSKVYRTLLELGAQTIIPLRTELDFVQSFVYLQQMRFDESLRIEFDIPTESLEDCLPPFALQLLVENAIKHNVISTENPLAIEVRAEADMLWVRNNYQPRSTPAESTGIGLKNLQARYEMITPQKPVFEKTKTHYIAQIPLIQQK